ncbi:MAG: hypothetical protein NTW86_00845, partial [Candidatus Sumerlaeota bacterium]|nr:hypothetical protein [Candidatus Sumerlaeota bacterium]
KKIGKYTYEMLPMDHKKVAPDPELETKIAELEKKWPAPPESQPGAAKAKAGAAKAAKAKSEE